MKVEEAEGWGDEFQQKPRRFSWWALRRNRRSAGELLGGGEAGRSGRARGEDRRPDRLLSARFNAATDENVRADLASLPEDLDRIDGWISQGVLGGDELNAADYQIAPSVRLLITFDDLRPAIERRPAGEHALRVVPDFPGKMPPVLPADWIPDLRS